MSFLVVSRKHFSTFAIRLTGSSFDRFKMAQVALSLSSKDVNLPVLIIFAAKTKT